MKGKATKRDIKIALEKLPTGRDAVNKAYEQNLGRIDDQAEDRRRLAQMSIIFLVHSRPLPTALQLRQLFTASAPTFTFVKLVRELTLQHRGTEHSPQPRFSTQSVRHGYWDTFSAHQVGNISHTQLPPPRVVVCSILPLWHTSCHEARLPSHIHRVGRVENAQFERAKPPHPTPSGHYPLRHRDIHSHDASTRRILSLSSVCFRHMYREVVCAVFGYPVAEAVAKGRIRARAAVRERNRWMEKIDCIDGYSAL